MVATGRSHSVESAREQAYAVARKVVCPNLRYRDDIGEKFIARDRAWLAEWGYFTSSSP
jgi:phosphoribosylamine--glycine ligase